jgi:spectinomycin phosphotransferase
MLIDWDTVGLALPERDLWWLARDSPGPWPKAHGHERQVGQSSELFAGLERYAEATGHHLDQVALRLFRLRWQLDDLIWCVRSLCVAHTETLDTQLACNALPKVVEVPEWMR